MIRLLSFVAFICVTTAQKISCSDDTPCAVYDSYVSGAGESGICDTTIGFCTVTCDIAGQSLCDTAGSTINEPNAQCVFVNEPIGDPINRNICVPPPSSDPTKTPTANPTALTAHPSSSPSSSPLPGTAPPSITTESPTKQPSSTPSAQPTSAPVCPGSGVCSCADDAPCDAAYTAMIQQFFGTTDVGKCNLGLGECTVTCDESGDSLCASAGAQIGLTNAICNTTVTPNICYVAPTSDPTKTPSKSPTSITIAPSIPPTKNPIVGTANPTLSTNDPTDAPSRPSSAPTLATNDPTASPICPASDICICDNDAPCDAAYTSEVAPYGERGVCDLSTNECTITCAGLGDLICTQAAAQTGMTGAVCHNTTAICYIPPTNEPTSSPSKSPTKQPTQTPSKSPTRTGATELPSSSPTKNPTLSPSAPPTKNPTDNPTVGSLPPTKSPTNDPTKYPTDSPTEQGVTSDPSVSPSKSPSTAPIACSVATYEACTCSGTDSSNWPKCDTMASDPTIAAFIGYLAPDVIACDVEEGQCTATCSNNAGTCTQIGAFLPGLVCQNGYCRPVTVDPTKKPTKYPTKSPTKSPSGSPTATGVTYDPTKRPTISPSKAPTKSPSKTPSESPSTRSPTKTGETYAPSKSPTKSPTKTPTVLPTKVCSKDDVFACTCSASDDSNCGILSSDGDIAPVLGMMGESILCDVDSGQCSVTCNTATTCTQLTSLASTIFTEELVCNSDATPPRCIQVVQPTSPPTAAPVAASESTAPTESPVDDDSDCATDYYPYNSDCSDTASDGCSLVFDIEVDVCTLNRIFTKYLIKLSTILSLQDLVVPISATNDVCSSSSFVLSALTVSPNNDAASARAGNKPQSSSDCPALDEVCDGGNAPGFTVDTTIALYCRGNTNCEDVELVAMQLVSDGIKLGTLNQVIEEKLKATSMGQDTVCKDGFGDVDIQSLVITFIDESGVEQEIGSVDVDEEDMATKRGYFVALVIVFAVYCLFV